MTVRKQSSAGITVMTLLKRLQTALDTTPESVALDNPPAKLAQPPPARGVSRFALLLLVAVVVLFNLPFITRHYMLGHDCKGTLALFDYLYSNYLYSGAFPHWMVYGGYGLDAAPFDILFVSAPSYLTMVAGKVFGVNDSLTLFSITICVEQLLLLLGFHLLLHRLLQERLAVFCICLTAVGLVEWQYQPYFNLRVFCLLPLAFYFILRLRYDAAGYCGWLAGIVAILGPQGSSYSYMLWALILPLFAGVVFWKRFGRLKAMLQLRLSNLVSALLFVGLALAFLGTLWHALDNVAFDSPGRDGSGKVSLATFLTYGGNNLSQMLSALLLPRAFMGEAAGRSGMADYVGLIGLFCLPRALRSLRTSPQGYPFAIACAVLGALSLGGVLAAAIYFFPGMHMFRHIGFLTSVIKVLVLILAGFGCDALIRAIRERTLVPRPTCGRLFLISLALLFYVDLNIGGPIWAAACEKLPHDTQSLMSRLWDTTAIYALARAALMFTFAVAAWNLCKPPKFPTTKNPAFALALLVMCIMGDCVLFQAELYSHFYTPLNPNKSRFQFPANKLQWPIVREEQVPSANLVKCQSWANTPDTRLLCDITCVEQIRTNLMLKHEAWTNTPGALYQGCLSCVLQWDPPTPVFRADWIANNVAEMYKVLGKASTQDLAIVAGFGGLKFRLLPDTSAIRVKTDEEARNLLGSTAGWDRRVILTDPGNEPVTNAAALPTSDSRLTLGEFSANSFALSLSNGFAQPAWLIYADAYSPGWHATVNGKQVPIVKAYGAFKAVQVQPGTSQVRFYYHAGIHSLCLDIFRAMAVCSVALGLLWLLWLIMNECFARGMFAKAPTA
jgi:hypothetical protein